LNITDMKIDPRWILQSESQRKTHNKEGGELALARIIQQNRHEYRCALHKREEVLLANVAGSFLKADKETSQFPVVGDWVILQQKEERFFIQSILQRRTAISRGAAGTQTREQVIASNIDVLFLVFGLDGGRNFLASLLERSLVVAWNSGAKPVILLNKGDLASEEIKVSALAQAEELAFGVPVHIVSAKTRAGLQEVLDALHTGETIGFLGKSGVGKSALVNALREVSFGRAFQEEATEGTQRAQDLQGRHTTTNSAIYALGNGTWIADVPGLRELKLWGDEENLDLAFPDIEELSRDCRFQDCKHDQEPGCAVRAALESGELEHRRFSSWKKLQRELAFLDRKLDERANKNE
jgi:ribosome biogenesis GTPase